MIFVIICLLFLFLLSVEYQKRRNLYFSRLPVFNDFFVTGDVIAIAGDGLYDNYNIGSYLLVNLIQHLLDGKFITHTGVVVVYDKPYICHMIPYPKWDDYRKIYTNGGPVFQDIHKFIHEYPGYVMVYKTPNILDKDICINNHVKSNFSFINWITSGLFKTNLLLKDKSMYCYELTAYMLGIKYKNITSRELINELKSRGYFGPFLCDNLYIHFKDVIS